MVGNFFRKAINKKHFLVAGSLVGVLSVVGRCSLGKIRQGIREEKETAILTKVLFCVLEFFGRSLVLLWFVFGLLHGVDIQGTMEGNLKNW